ncbi:MAG: hypothetical protein MRZ45_04420 [Blautia sp.]|nr:hypothetical protein [Blautia sp.]
MSPWIHQITNKSPSLPIYPNTNLGPKNQPFMNPSPQIYQGTCPNQQMNL